MIDRCMDCGGFETFRIKLVASQVTTGFEEVTECKDCEADDSALRQYLEEECPDEETEA